MQKTWGRLLKNWWGGGSFSQFMGEYVGTDSIEKGKEEDGGRDSLEKGKHLASSYTGARVNVY